MQSGEPILFAADNVCDIGTDAAAAKKIYANDLDLADDLVVDDDALVTGTLTVTEAIAANGHITLATTKDLLFADSTPDIGATGTPGANLYMTDGDFADDLVVDDDITISGLGTVAESFSSASDSTATLGTTGTRFKEIHSDRYYTTEPSVQQASFNILQEWNLVDGSSAAVIAWLPDASAVDGEKCCVILEDSTTNDITVKSGGGTVGKTDRSAAGAAAGTGIVFTDGDEDSYACWISDGTNWILASSENVTVD
jgi:hypothetical protein